MPLHRASLARLLWRQLAPSGNLCHPLSFSPELSYILSRALCKQREQLCESLCEEQDTGSVHALLLGSLLLRDTKLLPTLQVSAAESTSEGREGP